MECTVIAETSGNSIHPITAQLVGAASSLGATPTVVIPGGAGAEGVGAGRARRGGQLRAAGGAGGGAGRPRRHRRRQVWYPPHC